MARKKQFKTNNKISAPPETDGVLNLFDLNNPDIELFNMVDDELIKIGGSKIYLYKFLNLEASDDLYQENSMKSISQTPETLWGHYEPSPIDENITEFGIVMENDQTFTFNKSYVEKVLGRPIIAGDILKPKFQNLKYEVYEVQEDGFDVYGVYHLLVWAKVLRDDEVITQENDEFSSEFDTTTG
tara:strand:+ start:508 stop:1062 length:555 start_codon:yes stop_codon:yes gene_type:complete